MGKRWNRRQKKSKNSDNNNGSANKKDIRDRGSYTHIIQSNEIFELYYAYQGLHNLRKKENSEQEDVNEIEFIRNINPDEKEKERLKFLQSLRTILPSSFRISSSADPIFIKYFVNELQQFMANSTTQVLPSTYFKSIKYIDHAYQLEIDRRTIRKIKELEGFHEWLKHQTLSGTLTRQETVSMIPPKLLDIKPHHSVIDLCAAPGSKTCQILEMLRSSSSSSGGKGYVLANDADPKRAYMLVHQLRRMNSPCVVVTSIEAQKFPLPPKVEEGIFDRVLADVPCSGDGTLRKNPAIWKNWSILGAISLHPLQLAIALRGALLLKVGGYMCYSTCSMNPIENEAVVAEILRITQGKLELVSKQTSMPDLISRPGWNTWKVVYNNITNRERKNQLNKNNEKMKLRREEWQKKDSSSCQEKEVTQPLQFNRNIHLPTSEDNRPFSWDDDNSSCSTSLKNRFLEKGFEIFSSYDNVPHNCRLRVRRSCFPPQNNMNLERCIRILPQDMDTGGFFVALFHKKDFLADCILENKEELHAEIKNIKEKNDRISITNTKSSSSADSSKRLKTETTKVKVEEPVVKSSTVPSSNWKYFILPVEETIILRLKEYYEIPSDFPWNQIVKRATGEAKILYYINIPIKELVLDKFNKFRRYQQDNLEIIHTGLKVFERNGRLIGIDYRITQEGIQYLAPYMFRNSSKRLLSASQDDFLQCIATGNIPLYIDEQDSSKSTKLSDDFVHLASNMLMGSFVVALKGYENDSSKKMFLSMWKCRGLTLNCLVNKTEMDDIRNKVLILQQNQT